MLSDKFPFIYIGHGKLDSTYIDKCEECYIWFEREVREEEKKEIIKSCPPPLAGFFYWAGEFLHFGCADDTYDFHIVGNYCDEETAKMIKANDYSFLTGEHYNKIFNESLDKFTEALESWIIYVNSIVPISFFIGPNGSSGEDNWNRWSREHLREIAIKNILTFLENKKEVFSSSSNEDEHSEITEAGAIQKNLSASKIKYTFGFILRYVMKFPHKSNNSNNEKGLSDDLKIVEALFETDGIEHYIETLTYSDTRIKTNSDILRDVIKELPLNRQIEIIQTLNPYTQLAFYTSNYGNSMYLVNQKNPLEIVKNLLQEQNEGRKQALAGLLYFMANNMVKVGPGYGDKNDFTYARLAAEILGLSFDINDVRAEAFINAAAFYDKLKDFDKMLDVSLKGNIKFPDNTTIIANIIYSAQNLGKKDIADKFVNAAETFPSQDVTLLLNQTYNFITKGDHEKARELVLQFINRGGIVNPQVMNNILYTYIHGPADKYKDPFLQMTMNFLTQKNVNQFKTNKEFVCNATIVLNNNERYSDAEKAIKIYKENGGIMKADILNQQMYTTLKQNDSDKVKSAVTEFVDAFQSNAGIISGHEYVLHSAASCFGFLGDKRNALEYVRLAEWNGYKDFQSMKEDEYLKILYDDPQFLEMFNN